METRHPRPKTVSFGHRSRAVFIYFPHQSPKSERSVWTHFTARTEARSTPDFVTPKSDKEPRVGRTGRPQTRAPPGGIVNLRLYGNAASSLARRPVLGPLVKGPPAVVRVQEMAGPAANQPVLVTRPGPGVVISQTLKDRWPVEDEVGRD